MRLGKRAVATVVVARMERSEIRGSAAMEALIPDCASLHPGYERVHTSGAVPS
jgi:hypothetical protein